MNIRPDLRLVHAFAAVVFGVTLAACAEQPAAGSNDPRNATISAEGLHARLQAPEAKPLVVDVREPHEFEAAHIEGAKLAPLGNVEKELASVSKDQEIVLVCRSGNRSGKAQKRLAAIGYTNLRNMQGGMLDWQKREYPVVSKP